MTVVRDADNRRTATPNAVMTTLASPTQGATRALAMWRVEMAESAVGPVHSFDVEQVWTILAGTATVDVDGARHTVGAGDTLVLPAGVPRQVGGGAGFTAVVGAPVGARASTPGGDAPVLPPWIA